MNTLNAFLTNLTRIVLSLFSGWSPLATLVVLSACFGIVVAIAFRFTSNQTKLRRVADLCRAQVLAIKLFKDEPKTIVSALGTLGHFTLVRMWHLLPSMFLLIVPSVLLLVHLAVWYEYRPLSTGDSAVLELQLAEKAWANYPLVAPEVPGQLVLETPPLRDSQEKSIWWRVRVTEAVPATIRWRIGAEVFDKDIAVAEQKDAFYPVSVRRPGSGWWDRLLHPTETALQEDCPLRGIEVHYERRTTPLFGWDIPWWATVLIVSMLAAILVRPLVKVQF